MNSARLFSVVFLCAVNSAYNYKILGIFPHIGASHMYAMERYLEELAHRGHEVTVVSHFPRKNPIKNYHDISIKGSIPSKGTEIISIPAISSETQFQSATNLGKMGTDACENILALPQMQELMKSEEIFDLFIGEVFNADCFLAFAHKFKIPTIAWSTSNLMPWGGGRIGAVDHPAYIPITLTNLGMRMNFWERLLNSVCYVVHQLRTDGLFEVDAHRVAVKNFGEDLPALSEMAKNTSVLFVNTHFSFGGARPLVPGLVEVAGIHIRNAAPLAKDIEDYLNGAEHGVIYFSMGSMIRSETLPDEKRDAFLQAFSELPQRVLWKWEGDTLPGQPKNVKIGKWLPQFDILNHPKVRVFLAHGGLLGTIEAVHVGVPMVGIPMYGDQSTNIKMVEAAGMGIRLSYGDITKENVLKALRTVLDDPSYTENAKRTSRAFRDRPMSPMDTAIYWTEYVIRHKGAPHMRTAGADLPLYQYLLLDVIAVLLAGTLIVIYVTYFILKKIFTLICGSNKQKDVHKKRQ